MKNCILFCLLVVFFTTEAYSQKCPSVTVFGTTYRANPCRIAIEMKDGAGDTTISLSLYQDRLVTYGFSYYNPGDVLGNDAIIVSPVTGQASDGILINLTFKDSKIVLPSGKKKKIYRGHVRFQIYSLSTQGTLRYLELPFRVLVKK